MRLALILLILVSSLPAPAITLAQAAAITTVAVNVLDIRGCAVGCS